MARRNEHSLVEIKAMVLDAAECIIDNEGCAGLTIRKIAMEIDYTVGSIYMVFASRNELILHVNARTLADIASHLKPISTTGDIEVWTKAYLYYVRHHYHRWQIVFSPHLFKVESLPDWYQAHFEAVFQQFAAYFAPGSFEQQAVHALWQGIQGVCLLSSDDELEASALLLLKVFLRCPLDKAS
jgi:AcrR family transcriptional regulator